MVNLTGQATIIQNVKGTALIEKDFHMTTKAVRFSITELLWLVFLCPQVVSLW